MINLPEKLIKNSNPLSEIAEKILNNERLTKEDGLRLYESFDILSIGALADYARVKRLLSYAETSSASKTLKQVQGDGFIHYQFVEAPRIDISSSFISKVINLSFEFDLFIDQQFSSLNKVQKRLKRPLISSCLYLILRFHPHIIAQ